MLQEKNSYAEKDLASSRIGEGRPDLLYGHSDTDPDSMCRGLQA